MNGSIGIQIPFGGYLGMVFFNGIRMVLFCQAREVEKVCLLPAAYYVSTGFPAAPVFAKHPYMYKGMFYWEIFVSANKSFKNMNRSTTSIFTV
jgi:hypothetical protein